MMKLDSADLTLANGQVITVLDLTIHCERAPHSPVLQQAGENTVALTHTVLPLVCDCEGHEHRSTRVTVHGKTAAALHLGEELSLIHI